MEYLKISLKGVFELFILGAFGFWLVKRKILNSHGLEIISKLVVEFCLPLMIFCQLMQNFDFTQYNKWWIFPLLSLGISILGLLVGVMFLPLLKNLEYKKQFLSLVTFQNSGYLPLVLVSAILPKDKLQVMFIYIFLFLLGFNLIMWSVGVYLITFSRSRRFEWESFFSPPVVATILSLFLIYLKLNKYIPNFVYKPLSVLGDSTLPLAMLVVGGSLAELSFKKTNNKAILFLILAKLIIMPILGLLFIIRFKPDELLGLLLIIELAVPSATSLSLITRHYQKEDLIISAGIFWTHIISLLTLPLFLSLYFAYYLVK
jgi:predicted permease